MGDLDGGAGIGRDGFAVDRLLVGINRKRTIISSCRTDHNMEGIVSGQYCGVGSGDLQAGIISHRGQGESKGGGIGGPGQSQRIGQRSAAVAVAVGDQENTASGDGMLDDLVSQWRCISGEAANRGIGPATDALHNAGIEEAHGSGTIFQYGDAGLIRGYGMGLYKIGIGSGGYDQAEGQEP